MKDYKKDWVSDFGPTIAAVTVIAAIVIPVLWALVYNLEPLNPIIPKAEPTVVQHNKHIQKRLLKMVQEIEQIRECLATPDNCPQL